MALVPGTRLGPHEIISALGAGGMGESQGSVVQDKVVFVFNFFDYLQKIAPLRK